MSGRQAPARAAGSLPFSHPIRVYWEDTDAGGVVYHAAYLAFMERARTEWLRALGVAQSALREREQRLFAVHGMRIEFAAPARLDDALLAQVTGIEPGRASLAFAQQVVRPADGRTLVRARVRVACLDEQTFRPRALPGWLREQLLRSINEV